MDYFKLQNGSDIRGVALEGIEGEPVNLTHVETCGITRAFIGWLSDKVGKAPSALTLSVGCDSRLSAGDLKRGIFSGCGQTGTKVLDCGITSTPSMFMSTRFTESNCDGAIMVTASHLPFNRNGMKFFTREGGLDKRDIKAILTAVDPSAGCPEDRSTVEEFDLVDRYSRHLVDLIRTGAGEASAQPLSGMRIVVDAGNGAGGFFAEKVLKPLGADTAGSQFLDPDGRFPNHIPNPEDDDAIHAIMEATLRNRADLGIIFDTDVDRSAVIDRTGSAIHRNRLIALMSAIVLEDHPGTTIVTDSVTSDGLTAFIEKSGGRHHRFKRGYKNVIDESIRLNREGIPSHLAIETSGHGAFKENYFLDDGAYIATKALIKLAQLQREGKDLPDLIADLEEPKDETSLRVKITVADFVPYGEQVLASFREFLEDDGRFQIVSPNHEGIRANFAIDGNNGWVLLRMSLHDPVMPLNLESMQEDGCAVVREILYDFLKGFDKLLLP
ncbi:phosphomannomutase/phosphoglucomutase [Anaerotalea alkaliphila]|nr:phosphomannomutase/phosphoglucomutase [Anaerotalea alkaliphila]